MSWFTTHLQDISYTFLGILFEGIPFLLLGSLVSGLIDAFVPSETLAKILPKNSALAICLSGLLGGIFPMCECGSVIVVRRFIKKGLPISAAVTYMLASPLVNPIVAFSTYMAFRGRGGPLGGGQSPLMIMGWRLTLGFLLATAVGFIIRQIPARLILQPDVLSGPTGARRVGLTISSAPDPADALDLETGGGFSGKLLRAVQSATSDFLDVALFLVIGAIIASIYKSVMDQEFMTRLATNAPLSIIAMMALRFMLSLCSTSDAFIAASFTSFSMASRLAFMVFGPMFDLKLVFLYQVVFRRRFVLFLGIGLFVAVVLICLRLSMTLR
ncbi:MAG TPA: permease [Chthoniobacteraceae bacterium]|nr:permease [Chthoniobacteraceae bacterium]